jgi:hypothetical protein
MLGHAFAHFESQVQSRKPGVALLETLHDAHGVQVVVEARAEALHLAIQLLLAGVREGRMADVVGQRQGFGEIFVEPSTAATVRAICATSMVCVRRFRKWSQRPGAKTWVLASRRRKARECTTRSRSR